MAISPPYHIARGDSSPAPRHMPTPTHFSDRVRIESLADLGGLLAEYEDPHSNTNAAF